MANSTQLGRVFGIPIKVHITLWIVLPLIAMNMSQGMGRFALFWGLLAAIGLFSSVALHELGHSLVAIRKGCRVREILLLPIGGMAQLERMPRSPKDEFQVAIAGPAVSFALALIGGTIALFFGVLGLEHLSFVLGLLAAINLMLALFNLLPSFPMDGGRIFRAWMTPRVGRLEATRKAAKTGRFMAILFGIFAVLPPFSLILLAIAVFIYLAAGAEYRMVQMQEGAGPMRFGQWAQRSSPPQSDDNGVFVSPPPYAKHDRTEDVQGKGLFEELYDRWGS
jgi:stage IV sporulation protein FB